MTEFDAIKVALALVQNPMAIRATKKQRLPDGIDTLLKVATGDPAVISDTQKVFPKTNAELRAAAGFFVEQVLLSEMSDSYRTLGHDASATTADLRRHMALLMKWLHPDTIASTQMGGEIDRSVFARRITSAWENLKTPERRSTYDKSLMNLKPSVHVRKRTRPDCSAKKKRRPRQLALFPIAKEGFVRKTLSLFRFY